MNGSIKLVAADVSPLHLKPETVGANLRFTSAMLSRMAWRRQFQGALGNPVHEIPIRSAGILSALRKHQFEVSKLSASAVVSDSTKAGCKPAFRFKERKHNMIKSSTHVVFDSPAPPR